MSGYAARPPRPRTTYRCPVKVRKLSSTEFRVVSQPPIHSAIVRMMRGGAWRVTFETLVERASDHDTQERALTAAGELVSLKAGHDWKTVFTGPQRYAMGQQKCPRLVSSGTCDQTPEPGTIWCTWHPGGKDAA